MERIQRLREHVRLPQYNEGAAEWQCEAKRIVEFWMDTGIDGMLVDAVNWYFGITWKLARDCIRDVIRAHRGGYAQPEAAVGFLKTRWRGSPRAALIR